MGAATLTFCFRNKGWHHSQSEWYEACPLDRKSYLFRSLGWHTIPMSHFPVLPKDRSIEEKTIWSCHAPGSWSDVTMCSCQMSLCLAASGGSKKHRNATLKWLHTLKWLWKYIACVLKGKPRSCPLQWILLNYIAVSSWWCAHLSMADSFKDSDDDSVQEVPLSAQFRPPVSWLIIWFSLSAPSIHLGF